MTLDEPGADERPDQPDSGAAVATAGRAPRRAGLERHNARMRRSRIIYSGVISVVILVIALVVGVAWSHGEIAHTTLRTAAHPAPSVALRAPSANLHQAWRSDERTAIGTPYWGGTVVTVTSDSVRGRNASTGAITWSYTRTDRTVCQAIQVQGITVAVFELHGNCDQVTALNSASGAREWTRTLDENGQPLNGRPAYSVTQYAVMLTTPSVIYTIDPASGLDRWVYYPTGCAITGAVIGAQGALISQTCGHPDCNGLKFCGPGAQLLLRDANTGRSDAAKDKADPDQIKWDLIGTSAVPASADQLISAVDPVAQQLEVLGVAKGNTLSRLSLTGGVSAGSAIAALATDRAELLWVSGTTYAVGPTGASFVWTAPTAGPVTITQTVGKPTSPPQLGVSTIAAADPRGITLLDPNTGKTVGVFDVIAPAAGSLVYPFGSGFLVAATTTLMYQ